MKRLIDDDIDASARRVLEAGRDVHPDPAKKAALRAAITAGGVGLLTGADKLPSLGLKGAGWAAKLAKLGLVIAVAGTVGTTALMWQRPPVATSLPAVTQDIAVPETFTAPTTPSPLRNAPSPDPLPGPSPVQVVTVTKSVAPTHAGGQRRVVRTTPEAASRPKDSDTPSRLRPEAELVDALRHAVRMRDRSQCELLSARYWRTFGTGQLGPEVRHLDAKWRDAP
jgi:hypothetical protein